MNVNCRCYYLFRIRVRIVIICFVSVVVSSLFHEIRYHELHIYLCLCVCLEFFEIWMRFVVLRFNLTACVYAEQTF